MEGKLMRQVLRGTKELEGRGSCFYNISHVANANVKPQSYELTHLFLVLVDVEVELAERTQCVELISVESGLLHQVCVHVLIADARHLGYIPVIPEGYRQS